MLWSPAGAGARDERWRRSSPSVHTGAGTVADSELRWVLRGCRGAPSRERSPPLCRGSASDPHSALTAPSPSVLLWAPLSFFLIVSLTLRDSWHPPPTSPPEADPFRGRARASHSRFLFPSCGWSWAARAQSLHTAEWFVPDRPPRSVGLGPPAALDKPGDD